ncbi:transcriptional regulator, HTH_3 family [Vibrio cholerae]|uniref:helix-turn-helix domain-containing protein n=1 Tax=Vibrio cholerae TaxID=666 RepID=UPI0011DA4ACE|nr:XRE family transcriptional regulator [Vibrio cholerae]EJK2106732.1 helix-turn-helix transcriptional regulator [Vibrio cholerae]EKF9235108.1 helix-turn-helix transcriptional regulator [Vibrio cholerae]ELJ8528238.1 helix-turn-helix transcriptional regulator [Vibrio cholerae]TXY33632.1 helix-turn-helix domain-containing protein [Vibrio cholerae]GHW74780.1 transcriptional regulator, HTH_3 family [Vibrio cholerae]
MTDVMFKSQIANQLKNLRKSRGLSLDATAQLTGVSKAMLGQIERGESSPTIATLWKIASGLEASFSAFFANDPQLLSSERSFPDDPNMKVHTLFPYAADTGLEIFEITLLDHHQQMSSPHALGVIEYIYVLEGVMKVFFDEQWHELQQGEHIRFFSDQPHGYAAVTEKAVFQNIVAYPRCG